MPSNSILNIKKDGEWVEIPALKGEDGFSPTATVEKVGKVATITITDINGTTTATIADGTSSGDSGEKNTIESISVNGTSISPDENKNVDITVPDAYDDTALAQRISDIELDYVKSSDIPTKVSQLENDSNYLSSIPEEYITETELNAKGYLTEHQDISNLVEKEDGKTLISTEDISQIAQNKTDIETLNGTGEGSVEKKIADKLSKQTYLTKEIATTDEVAAYIADPTTAKFNVIYLVKDESATGADKYFEYQRIGNEESSSFQMTGDTSTDLSDYAKTADIPTTLPANGGNADTVNNHTVKSDVPENAVFTDTIYDDTEVKKSVEELSSNLDGKMNTSNPTGTGSFSLNRNTDTTVGNYSFAEGYNTTASGSVSHAEGSNTTATGDYSHSEGYSTKASGLSSHAEGSNFDSSSSILSNRTVTISNVNYTIGGSTAYGINSHAEGTQSFAYGHSSHSEGRITTASAPYSHAEGNNTTASALYSHAEGNSTTASGGASHAEGYYTTASGDQSHAEGYNTTASGNNSHAEGGNTKASGSYSHAEGHGTTASEDRTHAEGHGTKASNYASHASGKYNAAMTTGGDYNNTIGTAFVIGNGTGPSALSNAFSVQYDGTVKAQSTITASTTADYAEFFEWFDKNPDEEDRVGHFVTLDGDKIKIATSEDDYILGIVSGEPFVLGNGDCDTWNGMFLHDEFRRTMYEPAPKMIEVEDKEIIEEEYIDEETKEVKTREVEIVVGHHYEEVEGEYEGTRPVLNPDYDPTQKYISRFDRAEWAPVGMLGVLAVLHDGTAEVNGYVTVNNEGIATKCTRDTRNSYRVIKKVSDKVVEVIFR